MFTILSMWMLDIAQFPDWTVPVAGIIGFAALACAVLTGGNK